MRHFNYKSLSALQQGVDELGLKHIRFEADAARVQAAMSRPVNMGSVTAGNSMCVHPMEGCDGTVQSGVPDELTWRRYERFAHGGAKLLWFEATAVCAEGRANTRQLWINDGNAGEYARLLEMIRRTHREEWGRDDDLIIPVQLTHSGRYSVPVRTIGYHNPLIDQKSGTPADYPVITDDELDRLQDVYMHAARLAVDAGFRAIDVKVTHGYLLSELSGAKTREGRYGGPIKNRVRFACDLLRRLRDEYGSKVLLTVRLGCFDCVPYLRDEATKLGVPIPYPVPYPWGFGVNPENPMEPDLTDVREAIRLMVNAGARLFNISMGSPYYNPHIGRPFETPDDGNYEQPEHPLIGVDRHFTIAGELQRTFPDVPMVGTGYSWLQIYAPNAGTANLEDGNITFFGMGRNALAYPDFARDILAKGALDELRVCKTLTYCTYLMRQKNNPLGQFPTGCPPFDKAGYGQIMKEARAAQRAAKA
jgi:2,4-dienoyl-CoA reductase-like NADH-dependent reductase (Old Yellow Enzyme family)